MAPIPVEELYGEWNGNGCCCTPKCYRAKIDKSMCGSSHFCLYPGICGCGPSCPPPCGSDFTPCPCSENLYCNYPIGFIKFTSNSYVEPWPCPMGQGYVKQGGSPEAPSGAAIER